MNDISSTPNNHSLKYQNIFLITISTPFVLYFLFAMLFSYLAGFHHVIAVNTTNSDIYGLLVVREQGQNIGYPFLVSSKSLAVVKEAKSGGYGFPYFNEKDNKQFEIFYTIGKNSSEIKRIKLTVEDMKKKDWGVLLE